MSWRGASCRWRSTTRPSAAGSIASRPCRATNAPGRRTGAEARAGNAHRGPGGPPLLPSADGSEPACRLLRCAVSYSGKIMSQHEVYVDFPGRIVLVGFGSIGQGVLPLILRHLGTPAERISIVSADELGQEEAARFGVK